MSVGTDLVLAPTDLGNDDLFGKALAVGDFNGDGVDDLAVGVPNSDNGALANAGAVAVYFGALGFSEPCPAGGCASPLTRFDAPDVVIRGIVAGGELGRAHSSAGRIDGDAADELLIGVEA